MPPNKLSKLIKTFTIEIRKVELDPPYFLIGENIVPKCCEYIRRLDNARFVDNYYHTYYGEVKEILDSFISYWMEEMDRKVIEADRLENFTTYLELTVYVEEMIRGHLDMQTEFVNTYLPTNTEEQKSFEDEQKMFVPFMDFLYDFERRLKIFNHRDSMKEFIEGYLKTSLKKYKIIFDFTHTFIAKYLSTKLYEFRVSMEEILLRLRSNLSRVEEERESTLRDLLNKLYDGHKTQLTLSREDRNNLTEVAEIECSINKIRERIEHLQADYPITRLQEEIAYWKGRLDEFSKIENLLKQLKDEDERLKTTEKIRETMPFELASKAMKACCGDNMQKQLTARRKLLDEYKLQAAKALITFFTVKGFNRVFYKDEVGKYTVDEYGHQVYYFNDGSSKPHLNCRGEYKQVKEYEQKYLFDDNGRHVIESGQKVYQCAPCTSTYQLRNNNLLVKQTKDCGHSEKINPDCKMQLKNRNEVEILPLAEPVGIKDSLPNEVVTYIWKTFGGVLTNSLEAVGLRRSKNPIHHLAHEMFRNKYRTSAEKADRIAMNAENYRAGILCDRENKSLEQYRAWKSRQVKRRTPAGADDDDDRRIHDAQELQYRLICDINEMN